MAHLEMTTKTDMITAATFEDLQGNIDKLFQGGLPIKTIKSHLEQELMASKLHNPPYLT